MMRRNLLCLALAAILLAGSFAPFAGAVPKHERTTFVVGFYGAPDHAAVEKAGGRIVRSIDGLHVLVVNAPDASAFGAAMSHRHNVAFVQEDRPLVLDATGWNAAQWDATRWDATRWDATRWDATRWDATRWDATRWDATRWDATRWDATRWDATRWDSTWGTADPYIIDQWGLHAIEAPGAWNVTRGSQAIKVCTLDTGIDTTHPDLAGVATLDALDPNGNGTDEVGHGTHTTGILGARSGDGYGISGVANVSILSVRVLNATHGSESDLAAGLMACADQGARIASISLHATEASPVLEQAIATVQSMGMLVVASAGNDPLHVAYPASAPGVLAVGAADDNATAANFSGRGSALDLLAPGIDILSTVPGAGHMPASGTSMAAPFVAGAAALAWSVDPSLTAQEVAAILLATAKDQGPAGWDAETGAGLLDASAAVLAAQA